MDAIDLAIARRCEVLARLLQHLDDLDRGRQAHALQESAEALTMLAEALTEVDQEDA